MSKAACYNIEIVIQQNRWNKPYVLQTKKAKSIPYSRLEMLNTLWDWCIPTGHMPYMHYEVSWEGHFLHLGFTMCSSRNYPLPTEGRGNSEWWGGLKAIFFPRGGGPTEQQNFPEGRPLELMKRTAEGRRTDLTILRLFSSTNIAFANHNILLAFSRTNWLIAFWAVKRVKQDVLAVYGNMAENHQVRHQTPCGSQAMITLRNKTIWYFAKQKVICEGHRSTW